MKSSVFLLKKNCFFKEGKKTFLKKDEDFSISINGRSNSIHPLTSINVHIQKDTIKNHSQLLIN